MRHILRQTIWLLLLLALSTISAHATTIALFDDSLTVEPEGLLFHLDGTTTFSAPAIDMSSFDSSTGLGTITMTISGAGSHVAGAFFDHEIDELSNTFFNEIGEAHGAPESGQSWEIDEPGYVSGDIYDNIIAGNLDNSIGSNIFGSVFLPTGDDISMAMAWHFSLVAGETGSIDFILSDSVAPTGFHLTHFDPDSPSPATIYFSSALTITGSPTPEPVPEPGTLMLLGTGLAGMLGYHRTRRRAHTSR